MAVSTSGPEPSLVLRQLEHRVSGVLISSEVTLSGAACPNRVRAVNEGADSERRMAADSWLGVRRIAFRAVWRWEMG